ncbi:Eco57I restriction-modification methylase domain-containing protein [Deinococcus gobiensis]|uniref:site-specific DNA-methyltransferase (adenine-specific) n=1 Tax=Deinococcus gobiensis (strain DSM 21396 / JCM 16679 / CGMCC 1.7299 / I-0) TaxID=745776 RepID=H8H2L6_DEIGI|nr:Eco57I restriction-modification methylase domain-containing protein [Deinococcus gobiensis]AFD27763.1 Site-specific DNA-methyxltransferase [Deinococcus gobiensis I-0]
MSIIPFSSEAYITDGLSPSEFIEKVSQIYLNYRSYSDRSKIGQFFTNLNLAKDIANRVEISSKSKEISIIDLGSGTGMLSGCALEFIINNYEFDVINLDLVEIDNNVLPLLEIVVDFLSLWCASRNVYLNSKIITLDIIGSSPVENLFYPLQIESYDLVISNPPYFKIGGKSRVSSYYKNIINGQANAYTLFMYLGINLMKQGGSAIFITPQSYFNGDSFKKLREHLISNTKIVSLLVSQSRYTQFLEEKVMQKICITSLVKSNEDRKVLFNSINSLAVDLEIDQNNLIKDDIIYTPLIDSENHILNKVMSYGKRLKDFGLGVSTGSIVPHETPQLLSEDADQIPLIWLKHVKDGEIKWPIEGFKRKQYIISSSPNKKIMKKDMYILLRRCAFSETRKHLYCSVFEGFEKYETFSLENHVNYIYFLDKNINLEHKKVILNAVYDYLISDEASVFFKSRCNNTQINVTDIRSLPFPDLKI